MSRITLVFLALFLLVSGTARAQRSTDSLTTMVDAVFATWDKPDSPGAAVALVQDGEIIYTRGYGSANLEYDIPITPSSIFLIASVSKQFTAFAIAMLADQGKISLDDDIRTYVPEMHDFDETITIRHLVHHTSGLRDEFSMLELAGYHMDDVITKETILDLAYRQRDLNFTPGDEYVYCNTGYTLLAEIVERVTGQTFREWTSENLFEPLGMTSSHFRDDHGAILKNRAQGYYTDGDEGYKKYEVNYASVGASGLYTTVEDLATWANNFEEGIVGGADVFSQVHERGRLNKGDTLSYAFGQSVSQYKGHRRISHSGSHRGFRTYLARFPDDDLAVILLSNLEELNPTAKALEIADLYLQDAPERLADFAGMYHSEELGTTYHLVVEKGRLVAQQRRYPDAPLTRTDTNAFSAGSWRITFTREDGNVSGFRISDNRARDIRFVKL